MKIFVVIPLFNEEKHIVKVLKDIFKYKLPVIIVDDGSRDSSKSKIRNLKLKNVVFLEHKVNLGKGAAMKTGADYAFDRGANAVIFMDSDGQHEATDLPKFVKELKSGNCDVVFGSRNLNFGVPLIRYLGNKMASVFVHFLFKIYVSDLVSGFRALTHRGYKKIKWDSTGYGVETEMVIRTAKAGIKYCEIPVETIYYDKVKGVTILDAFGIFADVLKWKLTK
ncbi:MAG TPA: glycosyltransferase family 2 protein [Patescibacteria group bacterium]|nr:glycosyltransferase family 2 protein [Patescibacteria group bacterium]